VPNKNAKEMLVLALIDYRVKIGGRLWPLLQGFVLARTRSSPSWGRDGWMGEVYKARDTRLNRVIALKILSAEKVADADRKRRFLVEAQAASRLNHPNIVTIHNISEENSVCFIDRPRDVSSAAWPLDLSPLPAQPPGSDPRWSGSVGPAAAADRAVAGSPMGLTGTTLQLLPSRFPPRSAFMSQEKYIGWRFTRPPSRLL
jgi:serine/threonine protein kinase